MTQDFTSELSNALEANKNGKILAWAIAYLEKDEKNKPLLKHIYDRDIVKTELLDFPLKELERLSGPQNGEAETEPIHEWVDRVSAIEASIRAQKMPPPIIVTDFWQELGIADGNHRHEALLHTGYKTYWTIFLFIHHDSIEKIESKMKQDEK